MKSYFINSNNIQCYNCIIRTSLSLPFHNQCCLHEVLYNLEKTHKIFQHKFGVQNWRKILVYILFLVTQHYFSNINKYITITMMILIPWYNHQSSGIFYYLRQVLFPQLGASTHPWWARHAQRRWEPGQFFFKRGSNALQCTSS